MLILQRFRIKSIHLYTTYQINIDCCTTISAMKNV